MNVLKKQYIALAIFLIGLGLPIACVYAVENTAVVEIEEKGPHNGKMLRQDSFAIELAIVEDGVPPEFRVWASRDGKAVDPKNIQVKVTLDRLGDEQNNIRFYQQGDFLRGDMEIYEPHSFAVTLEAEHAGNTYHWQYDNFEGRVSIPAEMADANGLKTETAGPAEIVKTVRSYGRLITPVGKQSTVSARFQGVIQQVHVELGARVSKGDRLITIESNQGLNRYTITAPIGGVVTEVMVSAGEMTEKQPLMRLLNQTELLAELFVFPGDQPKLKTGAPVLLTIDGFEQTVKGAIRYIGAAIVPGKGFPVHIGIDNAEGVYSPGLFVNGDITTSQRPVKLAVKRDAIQAFRDFQVVYAKVDDTYEVRMLELGDQDDEWAEVLGGLHPGTEYVSTNSYVIKADIEKSGASHDH